MDQLSQEILKELLQKEREEKAQYEPAPAVMSSPTAVDHWTPAVLLEHGERLRHVALAGTGTTGETLKRYPRHTTMLSFRSTDGVAELHRNFADIFVVLDGRSVLATGGRIIGGIEIEEGEIRGTKMEGGSLLEIRAGDVAHVPAGVPHQMLVSGDRTFTAMVIKVQEKDLEQEIEAENAA
jgi:mannose-6-phosphate isomerase-like protein (cupin superfamily)